MLSNQLRNFCNARSSQLVLEHRAVVARCPGMGHPSRLVAHASSTVEPESAIYSNPELYEAAFSFRQIDDEVKFVSGAYAKHSGGAPLNSVLELGCGPALHSIGLAKEGVRLVIGMDLNQRMLDYAATKVQKETGSGMEESKAKEVKAKGFDMKSSKAKEVKAKGFGATKEEAPHREVATADMKADKPKEVKAKGFGVTKEEVPRGTAADMKADKPKEVKAKGFGVTKEKVPEVTAADMKADKPKEVKAKGFGVTKEEVPEVTAAGTWQDAIKFVCGDMRSFKLPVGAI
eukprot:gene17990-24403_t